MLRVLVDVALGKNLVDAKIRNYKVWFTTSMYKASTQVTSVLVIANQLLSLLKVLILMPALYKSRDRKIRQ